MLSAEFVEGMSASDVIVLRLSGSAGAGECDALQRAAMVVGARRPRGMVLDLGGLTFLSSLGIGMIVSMVQGVRATGGKVAAANASRDVRDALIRVRLDDFLALQPDVASAVATVSAV